MFKPELEPVSLLTRIPLNVQTKAQLKIQEFETNRILKAQKTQPYFDSINFKFLKSLIAFFMFHRKH